MPEPPPRRCRSRHRGVAGAATEAFRDASRHIGLLAHFLGDLTQPFHTATEAIGLDSLHFGYEAVVGAVQRSADGRPEWRSPRRTVDPISNIRRTAIATVVPGQAVRVTSIARDAKGRGVPNLLVTWTWNIGGSIVKTKAYTGSTGRASSTKVISTTTTMATVTVTARTQSGSTSRSSSTSFRRVA